MRKDGQGFVVLLLVLAMVLTPVPMVEADSLPCGEIIISDFDSDDSRTPIADCANPFNADKPNPFSYQLSLAGQLVSQGSEILYPPDSQQIEGAFILEPLPGQDSFSGYVSTELSLFYHEGNDYRQIFNKGFGRGQQSFVLSTVQPGTYTAVFKYSEIMMVKRSPLKKLFDAWQSLFITTAYAFNADEELVLAITFTIQAEEAPANAGASSVLFIPGIQASRLYTEGVLGTENQLWEPNISADLQKLAMTKDGESINDVYAGNILDTINFDGLFGIPMNKGDIYAGLINFLEQLKREETIKDWRSYAYDWRYDVTRVVSQGTISGRSRDLVIIHEVVEKLAQESHTGKVTIIAHSNGGLVAKALMAYLESVKQSDVIDQIIFIGTPHLGTPKTLATMLHGYDQSKGLGMVVSAVDARKIMKNLPGAYGLLPSAKYLEVTPEPVLQFTDEPIHQRLTTAYGTAIKDLSAYKKFLNNDEVSPERILENHLYVPATLNSDMVNYALDKHEKSFDEWTPLPTTKVSTIVGTGLPTVSAVAYQDARQKFCEMENAEDYFLVCAMKNTSRPFVKLSKFGDGTVTGWSAQGQVGGEKYYVDLVSISNLDPIIDYEHANITETLYTQNLIHNLLLSTSTIPDIPHVYTTEPKFVENYTIQKIASPVQIVVTDEEGNMTGVYYDGSKWVLKTDIPGSQYFELGGVKYVITPTGTDLTTILQGDGHGGYTYIISELTGSRPEIILHKISDATTTPTMLAKIQQTNGRWGNLQIDYENDGVIDGEIDVSSGTYQASVLAEATIDNGQQPRVVSAGTRLPLRQRPTGQVAGIADSADPNAVYYEQIINLLQQLQSLLYQYAELKFNIKQP